MKRWTAWAAALVIGAHWTTVAAAQDAYVASPSDLRVASNARADDAWLRGSDDLTGPEDIVGSSTVPWNGQSYEPDSYYASEGCSTCAHPSGACGCTETPLTRFRNSFYQGSSVTAGYLGDGGLGIASYSVSTRFAMPISGMDNVIIATPSFQHDMVDSNAAVDVPDNLFVTGVNFTWLRKLNDRWKLTAMVTPSIRSDFETSEDAFRIFGLGMVTYDWVPNCLDVSFGAVYLDRDDIPMLPVAGFTWTPSPDWRFEANFPRPRIAKRIDKDGACSETWIYTAVALGGNTWAVKRANGADDVLTIRDYQWVFGWEHLRDGGRGLFVETGAAFGRALEYESNGQEVKFDDSLFIRGGLTL